MDVTHGQLNLHNNSTKFHGYSYSDTPALFFVFAFIFKFKLDIASQLINFQFQLFIHRSCFEEVFNAHGRVSFKCILKSHNCESGQFHTLCSTTHYYVYSESNRVDWDRHGPRTIVDTLLTILINHAGTDRATH